MAEITDWKRLHEPNAHPPTGHVRYLLRKRLGPARVAEVYFEAGARGRRDGAAYWEVTIPGRRSPYGVARTIKEGKAKCDRELRRAGLLPRASEKPAGGGK